LLFISYPVFPDIKIDTLTISREQYDFVQNKIQQLGLEDRMQVIYRDYRDHIGQYSRIYSIEMFEAVGMQYWQTYFDKVKDLLKPSGVFSMQTIVIFDGFFDRYAKKIDFIQKYIFPGGCSLVLQLWSKLQKKINSISL
jgi:cyclopropane-fatty-acyl-phospholipid synthase